jgi:hypothetical protein
MAVGLLGTIDVGENRAATKGTAAAAEAVSRLFIPESLLPTQTLPAPADRWLRRLCRAILQDALECLQGRGAPGSTGVHPKRERHRRRQAAWDWIMSDAEYCFSFPTVCAVLNLDVGAVRGQLAGRFALDATLHGDL